MLLSKAGGRKMATIKIGDTIVRLRKGRHLTQEQLAWEIGIATKTMSRLENNEAESIRKDVLLRMCEQLDTSPDILFEFAPRNSSLDGKIRDMVNKMTPQKKEMAVRLLQVVLEQEE